MSGIERVKTATIEITGEFCIAHIVQEALIDKGYDIDIEPIYGEFHGPNGSKINVYKRNEKDLLK